MTFEVRYWDKLTDSEQKKFLSRSESDIHDVAAPVQTIIDKVKTKGDAALVSFTREFDKADLSAIGLAVSEQEFTEAEKKLTSDVKNALCYSIENVRRFHRSQKPESMTMTEIRPGILAGERSAPVESAGLYVPRGRGSFPSMLYMLAVPAQIAEVPRIAVATPPNPDGTVDPACLFAARLCGVHEVYRVGGAQAIAALAYGSESIEKVVKIIGPGSMYVAAAKRIVSAVVDVGLPAGPSESIILADDFPNPHNVALDLLIEAEHGSDSAALLITTSEKLAGEVAGMLPGMIEEIPEPRKTFLQDVFAGYGGIFLAEDMEKAADLVNRLATEHLQVRTKDPFTTLSLIKNGGEILLGEDVPFSAANYSVGANAVLPTGGSAKTCSAVSVRDFIKYSSVVYLGKEGYQDLKNHVISLADYEGFVTHGNALKNRKP